jgi:hypothetical protein
MSNRRFLLILSCLFSFITYTSCVESHKTLGSQFISDDFILKVESAKFEVPVTNVALDSIQGYNTSYMTFGYLNDETFGYTSGGFATQITPYTDSTYLGINPELKSIYIYMNIDSTSVLREDQRNIPQNIKIYKLKSDLDTLKMYNRSITEDDYYPTPINMGSPIFFGDDSIKIYLTEEFGRELLATSTAEYDSTQLFLERMKGIFLTSDNPEINPGEGRINYISMGGSTIYIRYYLTDPQRGYYRKDTTETFSLGYAHAINTLKTSSSPLATDNTAEKLYIQSLDGVKPHIKASDLKDILNTWISQQGFTKESVVISRAALVFPFEFDYEKQDEYTNLFPQQIFPCTWVAPQSDNLRFLNPLPEIYNNSSTGFMNRSLDTYTCEITNYIQDLMKDEEITSDQDLFISPIISYETTSSSSMYSYYYYPYASSTEMYYGTDNQNYRHGILNGSDHKSARPTLEITYCIVK